MDDGGARLHELFQFFLDFLSGAYDKGVASSGKRWRFHVGTAVRT